MLIKYAALIIIIFNDIQYVNNFTWVAEKEEFDNVKMHRINYYGAIIMRS